MNKVKEEKKPKETKEVEIVNDKVVSLDRMNNEKELGFIRKYKILSLSEVGK